MAQAVCCHETFFAYLVLLPAEDAVTDFASCYAAVPHHPLPATTQSMAASSRSAFDGYCVQLGGKQKTWAVSNHQPADPVCLPLLVSVLQATVPELLLLFQQPVSSSRPSTTAAHSCAAWAPHGSESSIMWWLMGAQLCPAAGRGQVAVGHEGHVQVGEGTCPMARWGGHVIWAAVTLCNSSALRTACMLHSSVGQWSKSPQQQAGAAEGMFTMVWQCVRKRQQ